METLDAITEGEIGTNIESSVISSNEGSNPMPITAGEVEINTDPDASVVSSNEALDLVSDEEVDDDSENQVVPSNEICKEVLGEGYDYIENPEKVLQRVLSDHSRVSKKYGIPMFLDANKEFKKWAKSLKEFADQNKVEIVFLSEEDLRCESMAAGYDPENGKIGIPHIDLDNCSEAEAWLWGSKLSHELVHHMQDPNMPIEKAEYEAYVVSDLFTAMYHARNMVPQEGYLRDFETVSYIFDQIEASSKGHYQKVGKSPNQVFSMKE